MPLENEVLDSPATAVTVGYAHFDPGDVDLLVSEPSVEQASAPTAQPETDIQAGKESPPEELPVFDPRCRDELEGLLFIGALTKAFRWGGHAFVIRTLKVDELIEVGLIHKEYLGTLGDTKAYQAAMVAAMIVTVDGRSLPRPLIDNDESPLRYRFKYVTQWFSLTLNAVYEEYLLLEAKVDEVLAAMGKVPG